MTAKNIAMIGSEEIFDESEGELIDSQLPVVCCQSRHCGKIEGANLCLQFWRMKERVSLFRGVQVLKMYAGYLMSSDNVLLCHVYCIISFGS